MNLFKYIVNVKLNKIKEKSNKSDINENLLNILLELLMCVDNINYKYNNFSYVMNNIFVGQEIKEKYIKLFNEIQNNYFSFIKFYNQYKFKKYKILIDTDLLLNPISKNNKYCIQIIQEKYKYLFTSNDIINLFNNSLTSSSYLFFQLSPIKNPYNNIIFDISTLYNMYFFIKERTVKNIELIDKFFLCNFNISKFKDEYKYLIREQIIKNYIKNSSNEQFKELLEEMMTNFYINNKLISKIYIHDEFPISDLRNIMKDYIYLYLTSINSLIEYKRIKAENKLRDKLIKFHNYNYLFGRKYYKLERYYCNKTYKFKHKIIMGFNKEHINFNDESKIWLTKKNIYYPNVINDNVLNGRVNINNVNLNVLLNNITNNTALYENIEDNYENEEEDEYDEDEESSIESEEQSTYGLIPEELSVISDRQILYVSTEDENTEDENEEYENTEYESTEDENTEYENTEEENTEDESSEQENRQ